MSSGGRHATNRPSRKARLSKGEFNSVAQVNGGLDNMINREGKDKDVLALIKYTADEGAEPKRSVESWKRCLRIHK